MFGNCSVWKMSNPNPAPWKRLYINDMIVLYNIIVNLSFSDPGKEITWRNFMECMCQHILRSFQIQIICLQQFERPGLMVWLHSQQPRWRSWRRRCSLGRGEIRSLPRFGGGDPQWRFVAGPACSQGQADDSCCERWTGIKKTMFLHFLGEEG